MANGSPRGSSIFAGLALISVGTILLLHNYRGLELGHFFGHWWPLLLIFWGLIKIYERTVRRSPDEPASGWITGGEVLLVLGLVAVIGIVVVGDLIREHVPGDDFGPFIGTSYDFDIDAPPVTVPANAHITIHIGRGDIHVRTDDANQIHVTGSKTASAWSQEDADRIAEPAKIEIAKDGDAYQIRPPGYENSGSRVKFNLDIVVPRKAFLTIRNEKGDIEVSAPASEVAVTSANGDVEVRDADASVNIEMHHGDAKVSDVKGDVKISGKGGEVEVLNVTGGFTLDGEFYGPIRADKIAKGVRFVSNRTDLTLTQLSGHMETGSGNFTITDAPGNLSLSTSSYDVNVENPGGKVTLSNRNGNVEVRFSSPPKDDVQITTASANISLSLPESSSFEIVADCHKGDIDSEFSSDSLRLTSQKNKGDDSHLEGKYGSGRGPKITLKTSYGSISINKTS